jgi:hypothetical protein
VGAGSFGASPLDGRWKWSWTRAELIRSGTTRPALLEVLAGPWMAEFHDGRFYKLDATTGRVLQTIFRFAVHGDTATFVFSARSARTYGTVPGTRIR